MFVVDNLRPSAASPPSPLPDRLLSCSSSTKDESNPTASSSPSSDYLKVAYSKARSLTGSSLGSATETSVSSSSSSFSDINCSGGSRLANNPPSSRTVESLEDIHEEEDVFFDCRSQASSSFSRLGHPDSLVTPNSNDHDEIARHINGLCVYADGRPAHVPAGNCISTVPDDYLEFCDDDLAEAQEMWEASQKWRQENQTWKRLTQANTQFHNAKKYYPTCYHGVDIEGTVMEYSFPGQMDPVALLPCRDKTNEVLEHYIFMQEYISISLYNHKDTWEQVGTELLRTDDISHRVNLISMVIDVKGAGIRLLTKEVFNFLKRMIVTSAAHYPAMASRCLVINSPFWVAGVFSTIRPLLPDTLDVEIVSEANTHAALRVYLDDSQIPIEYGGTSAYPLHKHPLELRLYDAIDEAAAHSNTNLQSSPTDQTTNHEDPPGVCSTLSSATNLGDDDDDDDGNDDAESVKEKSLCSSLPFSNALQPREPTFFVDGEIDGDLVLTPRPPSMDYVGITRNFWNSLVHGFEGCGNRRAS